MGHISKSPYVLEPTQHFVEKQGLLIARSLVDPAKGVVPLRVLNLQNEPCKIYKNTIAATCEPVNELDIQLQEMSNETDCHKVCMSKSQNSPKELPPHIQDLYNRSATNLHERECFSLKNLLVQYQDIFSKNDKDIGHTEIMQHSIDTGGVHPIRQKPRRVPLFKMAEAESEIRIMADQGVIEPSTSPWSFNIVLVEKKDNSLRFCVDFRQLNDVTKKDSHPLPRIDDTLDALSGAKLFNTLDLNSGYWQVGLTPENRPKTAFFRGWFMAIHCNGIWLMQCPSNF